MLLRPAALREAPPRGRVSRGPGRSSRWRRRAVAAGHAAVVVALVVAAAWLRRGPLGPSSLWLDDAWIALVTRADSVGSTAMVGMTAPGFAFLLRGWLAVVGFTEAQAQLLPFVFGVAGPAVLYLAAVRSRFRPLAAAVAASLLATAPVHVAYATRVKHYTLDVVLAIAVIAVACWALDDLARTRRWFAVAGVAVLATASSGALAPYAAGAAAAGAVALRPGAPGVRPSARRAAVVALAGYTLFAAAWWWAVLRPVLNPHFREHWNGHYLDVGGGVGAVASALGRNLLGLADGLAAAPTVVLAVLVVAGGAMLAVRRPAVAVLLVTPPVVAVVLAAFRFAPLGGGRTDAYLYPALALLAAACVDGMRRVRWLGPSMAAAVAVTLVAGTALPEPYPAQDVRPLVAEVERRAGGDDTVVVYPATIWAYALYTGRPVTLVEDRSQGWGFEPRVGDARVVRLGRHRSDPDAYGPEIARIAADRAGDVWLVASHWRDDLAVIEARLSAAGLREIQRWERPGARLFRYRAG